MHESHDALIGDGFELVRYADLPRPYQLALAYYMAVNGDAWDAVDDGEPVPFSAPPGYETMPEGRRDEIQAEHRALSKASTKRWLEESLPEFVQAYGDETFGVSLLPAGPAKAHVMAASELRGDWNGDWDAYHAWYVSRGSIPDHGRTERWPCIMSGFESEAFEDGWHRFHSYCRAGDETIPVVFYPSERHFLAKGMEAQTDEPASSGPALG